MKRGQPSWIGELNVVVTEFKIFWNGNDNVNVNGYGNGNGNGEFNVVVTEVKNIC